MKKTGKIADLYEKYVIPTYTQSPLCIVKGSGAKVRDIEGREYLDFFPGWAVSGLGHCPERVVKAVKGQLDKIMHVPNNYMSEPQPRLAKTIIERSFPGKVFFANSGAEANEAAVKLARRYGRGKRYEVITMEKSFHGRTLAMITATGQDKVKTGFSPLPEGFTTVPYNDLESVKNAVTDNTAAIMLELIQGEGGINVAGRAYIKEIRRLCDKKDILLIFDEVQTGMGRTGKTFCYQNYGVQPDMMTLAKSLGGGVPIGAMVAGERIAGMLGPGSHASTFGGNPLVCAAALAVFRTIEKDNILENVNKMGAYLMKRLGGMKKEYKFIKEIRGMGLMAGVELSIEADPVFKACFDRGLLINATQKHVLRIMPPLNIKKKELEKGIGVLERVFGEIDA